MLSRPGGDGSRPSSQQETGSHRTSLMGHAAGLGAFTQAFPCPWGPGHRCLAGTATHCVHTAAPGPWCFCSPVGAFVPGPHGTADGLAQGSPQHSDKPPKLGSPLASLVIPADKHDLPCFITVQARLPDTPQGQPSSRPEPQTHLHSGGGSF